MFQQMPKEIEDARTMEYLFKKSAGTNLNKLKRERLSVLQLVELEGWGYTMTLESRKVYHKT